MGNYNNSNCDCCHTVIGCTDYTQILEHDCEILVCNDCFNPEPNFIDVMKKGGTVIMDELDAL